MKKKLLYGGVGGIVLILALLLVGPSFVDWNSYKSRITDAAANAIGRELTIQGDLSLAFLPTPRFSATDIRLANAPGGSDQPMVQLSSVEIRIALGPLLGGNIQVDTVRLVDPVVHLEKLADGTNNWTFTVPKPSSGEDAASGSAAKGGGELPVRLEDFTIENGTLVYNDAVGGVSERVERLNARIGAGSLQGPFSISGKMKARGLPMAFDAAIGQIIAGRTVPLKVEVTTPAGAGRLAVDGAVVGLDGTPEFKGTVTVTAGSLAGLIQGGTGAGDLPGILGQAFRFNATLKAGPKALQASDAALMLGDTQAKAAVEAVFSDPLDIRANVNVGRIDLDQWLNLPMAKPQPLPEEAALQDPNALPLAVASGAPSPAQNAFSLPKGINAELAVNVQAVTYKDGLISDGRMSAQLANGELTLSQLSAQAPGGVELALFGFVASAAGQPQFEGDLELRVADLRSTFSWLGLPALPSAPDRLRKLDVKGKVRANPDQAQLAGLEVRFDSSRLLGGVTLALTDRLSFGAALELDQINLDSYLGAPSAMPVEPAGSAEPQSNQGATAAQENPLQALKALTGFDANVSAKVGRLTTHGLTATSLALDATLFNGKLTLRQASVGDFAGLKAGLSGEIDNLDATPKATPLKLSLQAKSLAPIADAFAPGLPLDARKLGAVSLDATIEGTIFKPKLDAALKAVGGRYGLDGQAALLPPGFEGTLAINHPNLANLVRAFGVDYRPQGPTGGVGLKSQVKAGLDGLKLSALSGTLGEASFSGNIDMITQGQRPKAIIGLALGDLQVDPYLPAEKEAAGEGTSASSGQGRQTAVAPEQRGRWARERLDLSGLKSVDADVVINAKGITFNKYRLTDVKLSAGLVDGVLQSRQLAGWLFGGALDGSLGLKAGKAGLESLDVKVALESLDVAEAVAAFAGGRVATGRMNFNADLATKGESVFEIVSRLNGKGAMSINDLIVSSSAKGSALAPIIGLVSALSIGSTKVQANLNSEFIMNSGVATLNNTTLTANIGSGVANGKVDLPAWWVDVTGGFKMNQASLAGILGQAAQVTGSAEVPFSVKGPLDDPKPTVDTAKLLGGGIRIPSRKSLEEGLKQGLGGLLGGSRPSSPPSGASDTPPPSGSGDTPPPPPPSNSGSGNNDPVNQLLDLFKKR